MIPTPTPLPEPTQVRHPWHAVRRTLVAVAPPIIGAISLIPVIVPLSGLATTAIGAGLIGFSVAVTRILAHPDVDAWLVRHAPWLSAKGRSTR